MSKKNNQMNHQNQENRNENIVHLDYYCSVKVLKKIIEKNPVAKIYLPNGKEAKI